MGISKISISNFQSHRETVLDLHPGVNLIVGSSDSGKTAIIRALKWLATNRPLGDGFVSWNSKGETAVEVLLDDGVSIRHELGKYSLKNGKDKQEWSAIGTTVPEAIMQALNISELSWQSQMDAPFLLSASPGEVARTLNEVADLDKIDSSLVNINRMARDNRQQLTECAQQKQRLEIDLSAFRELDSQLAKVAQLKEMERKARLLEEMVANGSGLVASATEQEEALARYRNVEKNLEHVRQLNKQMADYETIGEGIGKGQRMLAEVMELSDRLKAIKDLADAEAELDLLLDMVGQAQALNDSIGKNERQLGCVLAMQKKHIEMEKYLERLESQWREQFPEVCPLCGRSG
jgi:exonuclease SbcC